MLVLAELGANAGEKNRKPEGLGDIIVRSQLQAKNHVGVGGLAGQHDDGMLEIVLAQKAAGFAAVHIGKPTSRMIPDRCDLLFTAAKA